MYSLFLYTYLFSKKCSRKTMIRTSKARNFLKQTKYFIVRYYSTVRVARDTLKQTI